MTDGIVPVVVGDDATLRTHASHITNEHGNLIVIAAAACDKEVAYTLSGPHSVVTNRITLLEAIELLAVLAEVLGVKSV